MTKITCLTVLALTLAGTGLRAEHQDSWLVRVRGLSTIPSNKSDSIPDLYIPSNVIALSNKTLPELDLTYCFNPNFAVEFALTGAATRKVTVNYSNISTIGTVKTQSPCLVLQWRMLPDSVVNPYFGIGLNDTRFSGVDLTLMGAPLSLAKYNINVVYQAGMDIQLADHWFLNLDIKSITAKANVNLEGGKLSAINYSPMVYGVGVGFSF